jgi:hypothetical protein
MAKRVNSASFKGYLHKTLVIEEFGKREDDPSEFFDLKTLLEEDFVGKMVSITIKEEQMIPSLDEADIESDEE